ncbi:hypothetical protein K474DRAFT_1453991 [Panus rudis PR-1116 ss-1]|nr:hypothetical protein K474DRAFT_1453991 [Panus rudis PR-1116 ss-1]
MSHNNRRAFETHYSNFSTTAVVTLNAKQHRELLPESLLQLSPAQVRLGFQSFLSLLVRLRALGPDIGIFERCCTSFLVAVYCYEMCCIIVVGARYVLGTEV